MCASCTAGVHAARDFRSERFARLLVDRQRVHIGTQPDGPARKRPANDADNTRFRDPPMIDAELVELTLDERRRANFLEAQLRVPVDLAP